MSSRHPPVLPLVRPKAGCLHRKEAVPVNGEVRSFVPVILGLERESMSFWQQHQKFVMQQWELRRRRIEREVAERRRDLVRRNLRQSSEWSSYEPYTEWYLEREVEAFVGAVDEVSGAGQFEIDDP